MKKHYIPPKQGMLGQVFDTIFVLVLVYASLMVPLLFTAEQKADDAKAAVVAKASWESLGQNAVQQAQWIKLGYDPDKAAVLINNRFDYTIDPVMLIVTILVVAGYFIFMLTVSDKQYREVIREKFDNK